MENSRGRKTRRPIRGLAALGLVGALGAGASSIQGCAAALVGGTIYAVTEDDKIQAEARQRELDRRSYGWKADRSGNAQGELLTQYRINWINFRGKEYDNGILNVYGDRLYFENSGGDWVNLPKGRIGSIGYKEELFGNTIIVNLNGSSEWGAKGEEVLLRFNKSVSERQAAVALSRWARE